MPPARTAIHLCAGTDAAKTLLALREAGVRSVAVNTSTRYRLDSFDFAPERVPVAANLYERALSPVTGAALLIADYIYFNALRYPEALVSLVSSFRRGSTLVAFAGGLWLFGETYNRQKLFSVLGVLLGIVLTILG